MSRLAGLPAPLVLAIAAVVLAMESGLLVGIALPGAPLVLGLGLVSRFGVAGFAEAVLTVAAATISTGSQFAFLAAGSVTRRACACCAAVPGRC